MKGDDNRDMNKKIRNVQAKGPRDETRGGGAYLADGEVFVFRVMPKHTEHSHAKTQAPSSQGIHPLLA